MKKIKKHCNGGCLLKEEFIDDGWDCEEIQDSGLLDTLRKCCNLEYNLRTCNRGASNFGDTLEDLKAYVNELAEELKDAVVGFPGEDIDECAHDWVTIDERLDELDDDGWPKKDFTVGVFKNGELIERFKDFDAAREWAADTYDIGDDDVTIEDLYGDECYADLDPHDPMLTEADIYLPKDIKQAITTRILSEVDARNNGETEYAGFLGARDKYTMWKLLFDAGISINTTDTEYQAVGHHGRYADAGVIAYANRKFTRTGEGRPKIVWNY